MINEALFERLKNLGFELDINQIEDYIESLQEQYGNSGKSEVTDYQYDELYGILQQLKPDSRVFAKHSEEEYEETTEEEKNFNSLLETNPMRSIRTVQVAEDLNPFFTALNNSNIMATKTDLEFVVMEKLNGHAIRAVYQHGKLIHGTLRGRYKLGRTILKHLQVKLPQFIEEWSKIPLLEVRAEALVSTRGFEEIQKVYLVKTPLSAVTSFIRESSTVEEMSKIDYVAYAIELPVHEIEEGSVEEKYISSKEEQLLTLQRLGFQVPVYRTLKIPKNIFNNSSVLFNYLESLVKDFQKNIEETSEYLSDGCVLQFNSFGELEALGGSMKYWNGTLALKIGNIYGAKIYKSIIEEVLIVPGKVFMTPKARIKPVKTSDGRECTVVPLYNPAVMQREGLWVGQEIYFKFGAETGVTLCREDGTSVRK